MAGREGFEPPEVLPSTVFKTAAFNHSAISRYKNPTLVNLSSYYDLEATPRFELGNQGFAGPCLTTWLCRPIHKAAIYLKVVPETGLEPVQTQCPRDFKSLVSTNFTTRANQITYNSKYVKILKVSQNIHKISMYIYGFMFMARLLKLIKV